MWRDGLGASRGHAASCVLRTLRGSSDIGSWRGGSIYRMRGIQARGQASEVYADVHEVPEWVDNERNKDGGISDVHPPHSRPVSSL